MNHQLISYSNDNKIPNATIQDKIDFDAGLGQPSKLKKFSVEGINILEVKFFVWVYSFKLVYKVENV